MKLFILYIILILIQVYAQRKIILEDNPSSAIDLQASTVNPPTPKPTRAPIALPTKSPVFTPTNWPTRAPVTARPTRTAYPTKNPNFFMKPTTNSPTVKQTSNPTVEPTINPTTEPSSSPSIDPTNYPTVFPTESPTFIPSLEPSLNPSYFPTIEPSGEPSNLPTNYPSISPTNIPSSYPTNNPTFFPSESPTIEPTYVPSSLPTNYPTTYPTSIPTINPTTDPTLNPTSYPSINPTTNPTTNPTLIPTSIPTITPTFSPSITPTRNPTSIPTANPTTFKPTSNPTTIPTTSPAYIKSVSVLAPFVYGPYTKLTTTFDGTKGVGFGGGGVQYYTLDSFKSFGALGAIICGYFAMNIDGSKSYCTFGKKIYRFPVTNYLTYSTTTSSETNYEAIACDSTGQTVVFGGHNLFTNYIFVSTDYGVTVTTLSTFPNTYTFFTVALVAINAGIFYIGDNSNSRVYKSGADVTVASQWSIITFPVAFSSFVVDTTGTYIYGCNTGTNSIYYSSNGGSSFTTNTGTQAAFVSVSTDSTGQYVYAATSTSIYLSNNYAVSFSLLYTITTTGSIQNIVTNYYGTKTYFTDRVNFYSYA